MQGSFQVRFPLFKHSRIFWPAVVRMLTSIKPKSQNRRTPGANSDPVRTTPADSDMIA
jgi:hypothetical protein